MSAREIIAHAAWRHEATSGSPSSVANARTLEAFADSGPLVRVKWLSSADAILAALPDMIAPLVWEFGGYAYSASCVYCAVENTVKTVSLSINGRLVGERFLDYGGARSAANTHHRAAIMAAFNDEAKT